MRSEYSYSMTRLDRVRHFSSPIPLDRTQLYYVMWLVDPDAVSLHHAFSLYVQKSTQISELMSTSLSLLSKSKPLTSKQ